MAASAEQCELAGAADRRPLWSRPWVWLIALTLAAALLRLPGLESVPPGIDQDESPNAWNARCLIVTGKDYAGQRWPIFYTRSLGANRSTLYVYLVLVAQCVGGMSVWTTRLPAAVLGVATVPLIYYVGRRMFCPAGGLVAAMLLAFSPWHIMQSRWGHEASICATLGLLPLAAALWAGLPFVGGGDGATPGSRVPSAEPTGPRPVRALFAGLLAGVCCYGYQAARIYIPAMLGLAVLVTLPGWIRLLRRWRGALAGGLFFVGFLATFGPLAHQHLTNGEVMNRRGDQTWVFSPERDSLGEKASLVWDRYLMHFSLDALFVEGDPWTRLSPYQMGMLYWYMLPLMLLGCAAVVAACWRSPAARVAAVLALAYPAGDILTGHSSAGRECLHGMRALPGLGGLVLLAAFGASMVYAELSRMRRWVMGVGVAALVVTVGVASVRYLPTYYRDWPRQRELQHGFWGDLLEASRSIRGEMDDVDAVFITTRGMNRPYVTVVMGLDYDPVRWFAEPLDVRDRGWDHYDRHGKIHYLYRPGWRKLQAMWSDGVEQEVILILRPNERSGLPVVREIRYADGSVALVVRRGKI